jgi:hypothetical protein
MTDQELLNAELGKAMNGRSWNIVAAETLDQKPVLPFRRRVAIFIVRQMLAFTIFVSKILGVK